MRMTLDIKNGWAGGGDFMNGGMTLASYIIHVHTYIHTCMHTYIHT